MRKLVAALACRVGGSRLYGKPMQMLDVKNSVSVLDHMIALLKTEESIDDIVLGISEGAGNDVFREVAERHGISWIEGDQRDVLQRLIQCGEHSYGTDVFRITTESPFAYFESIAETWERHVERGNDVTVIDCAPEGSNFEIYTLDALRTSHQRGDSRHRSEYCSLYVREHRDQFTVDVIVVPADLARLDLRLTIDNPEDLILCRAVYTELAAQAPRIPLSEIIRFLDRSPELRKLVEPFVVPQPSFC